MARKPSNQLLLFLSGQGVLPNGDPELRRMLSYGAGLDSFGLLCLAYEYFLVYGRPLLDHIVFADTGDPEKQFPGEWPETYEHIRRVAIPLARAAGIPFKVLDGHEYPVRGYSSLFELLIDKQMMPSTHPKHRLCTIMAKIERVELFSATLWPAPIRIETWIGLEAGEESRLEGDPYSKGGGEARRSKRFPLMDLGLCRCRLGEYVRRLGLPIPPKSACMYCVAGETKVVTRLGVRTIAELAGGRHDLLVPQVGTKGGLAHRGSFREVEVRSFGVQPLWEVKLRRGQSKKAVRATAEHRWFLAAGPGGWKEAASYERTTATLAPGDRLRTLRATAPACEAFMPVAAAQGFTYGDGSHPETREGPAEVTFYARKDVAMLPFFGAHEAKEVVSNKRKALRIYGLPRFWKRPPPLDDSRSFLLSWLAGYFAADGTVDKKGSAALESASLASLEVARDVAAVCGVGYSPIGHKMRKGFGDEASPLFWLSLRAADLPEWFFLLKHHRTRGLRSRPEHDRSWAVESVRRLEVEEEVFCAVVPGAQAFGLADDLMTGNCPAGNKADFRLLLEQYPGRFAQAEQIDGMRKITKQGIELRLAGNHKTRESLKEWALSPYKPRPPACKVCGAAARAEKSVGSGGDPLPPGTGEVYLPPSPEYKLRDLVTGDVSMSLGCRWAVGLPDDADAATPARLLGEAPDDPLKVRVRYARAGGGEATAVLRPGSVTVWFGRPMLLPVGGDVLHPAATLAENWPGPRAR